MTTLSTVAPTSPPLRKWRSPAIQPVGVSTYEFHTETNVVCLAEIAPCVWKASLFMFNKFVQSEEWRVTARRSKNHDSLKRRAVKWARSVADNIAAEIRY